MGKTLSEDEKSKKSWDSNAITPGTPFMDFLAASLRYWVVQKLNNDPGWKGVCLFLRHGIYADDYLTISCKLSSPIQVFLVKENIRSWISYDAKEQIQDMTRTPIMLYMDL